MAIDVTNGVTSTGITLYDESMYVSNGGKAENTTVNANGMLYVSNGGTADKTTVNGYWGYLYVSNGGTATNTLVNANGEFDVFSGGVAAKTTVKSGGRLEVLAGGTATEITAVEGAYLGFGIGPDTYVKGASAGSAFEIKDGIAANFTLNNGYLNVASDGTADNTTVNDGGYMWVSSDGVAANTTVKSGGRLGVRAGGTATKIAAVEGAYLEFDVAPDTYIAGTSAGSAFEIKDGSVANFTLDRGFLHVSAGGTADNTTVNHIGLLVVSSGGTANNTTLNKGYFIVSNGGTATGITAVEGAYLRFAVAPDTYIAGTYAGSAFEIKDGSVANYAINYGCILYVSNGGTADNTTVNDGGWLIVSSGGTADNTTVNVGGSMWVSGTADNTTVNDGGWLIVFSGGTADNTTVNGKDLKNDGYLLASAGGTVTNTTLNDRGALWVFSGGTAINTTVNDGGYLEVSYDGTATNTTVNEGGVMWVDSGCSAATNITVNSGGALLIEYGCSATEIEFVDGAFFDVVVAPDTYVQGTSAGSAFEIKNGVVTNFTLKDGHLNIFSGTASKTTVNSDGNLDVRSGGTAINTTVNDTGNMYVERGLANSTTVKSGGSMRVVTGGTANSVTVSSGGKLDLFEDGVLTGRMTFSSGAVVSAYEGGGIIDFDLTHTSPSADALVNDLSIVQGAPMYTLTVNGAQNNGAYKLADGASGFGSKTEITVRNPVGTDLGVLTVDSKSNTFSYGGKLYTLQLNDESLVVTVISESGADNIVTGDVNGQVIITEGSSALGATVNGGGMLVVQDGGKGNNIMINNGGLMVATDAQLKGVTVDKGGVAYIGSDAIAKSLVINGGEAHIESDGWAFQTSKGSSVASNTIVKNGGMLYISGGGHVEGLLASGGGHVIVESDGALEKAKFAAATLDALKGADVSSVTLLDGGTMNVFAGGSAQGVTISEGGILNVESGGELNTIHVSAGGILTGVVKGGTMIRMHGGTLDFNISGLNPDSVPYLYEETDIDSTEEYLSTLTIGDAQTYGTYGLLDYAYGFSWTVTVQDTSGKELGTLTVGATANINGVDYTLNLGGSPGYPLTVTVADNTAPTIMNITADITDPTTSNVTVTAEFSDNAALASKQYRIGDGAWTDYTTGVLVTENATVYFKAVDTAGNETTDQYAVTNIDREKPEVLNVTPDNAEFTNQNVTVTADFTDNMEVAAKQYRIGDGAWTDYTTGVVVDKNTTVYFKAVDTAGNESDVAEYTVANIDKIPPTITITPSTTESGAESVTLSAVCKDETSMSSILQYRIGDGAWQDCTADVVVTENTTVSFRTYDTAGNETIESYAVTNIKVIVPDTTKPTVTNVKADITAPTNGNVTVTADYWDDVALLGRQYRIDDFPWTEYPDGGAVIEDNATVSFKAVDTSENESEIVSIVISNIDKVKPTISYITPSTLAPAASVTVTAFFADEGLGLATKQYRIGDGGVWQDYTDAGVTVTENVTVYFKATDAAGNETTESYEVTNIDKVPPTITNITPSTTALTDSVTVTATFKDDVSLATKQYKIGDGSWQTYVDGVTVTENVTVYFKATDTAGNEKTESYEVTNIGGEKPLNGPAEPKNNSLYLDKTHVNTDITEAYGTVLTAAGDEVFLDQVRTVFETIDGVTYGNSVDRDDTIDYAKIVLEHGAKLSFHVSATAAATFTVYRLTQDKKGKYALKSLQTLKLADKDKDGVYTADSSKLVSLSASGAYYVSMKFTDKDKSKTAYYNVTLNGEGSKKPSEFYPLGNNTDDWGDRKTAGYGGAVGDLGKVVASGDLVKDEWVGFGDKADYKKFTLDSAAELSFVLNSSLDKGPLTLTVCRLKETVKASGTTYSEVKVKDITLKSGKESASLNNLRLAAGDYYLKVETSSVKKSTGYEVKISDGDFYTDGDGGWNNVLLNGKALNENAAYFYDNVLSTSGAIHLDKDGDYRTNGVAAEYTYNGTQYGGFVCFGDETDYAKLSLSGTADVTFSLSATNDATLEIVKVTQSGTKYTQKSVKTAKYKAGSDAATAKVHLEVKDNVSYYVSVKATNVKKTSVDPRTYYDVSYEVVPKDGAALAMPETSDALAMTDSLSFGQYADADVLANASASTLADFDGISAMQNLTTLA